MSILGAKMRLSARRIEKRRRGGWKRQRSRRLAQTALAAKVARWAMMQAEARFKGLARTSTEEKG